MKLINSLSSAPNIFIIGAAKSGTTTLYHLLNQHPDIFMTKDKEPRYFNVDECYKKGLDFYLKKHFTGADNSPIRGEASPGYLPDGKRTASRILSAFGDDLKFVVILRNPVQRAWSHYQHVVRLGVEKEKFVDALKLEDARIKAGKPAWAGYFNEGLYAMQLEKWFDYFPKEKFLILLTSDLKDNPKKVARKIFKFVGVNEDVEINTDKIKNAAATAKYRWIGPILNRPNKLTNILKHAIPYEHRKVIRDKINEWNKRKTTVNNELDKKIANELRKKYHDDVAKLEKILDRDLSHWMRE